MKRKKRFRWALFGLSLGVLIFLGLGGIWLGVRYWTSDEGKQQGEQLAQMRFSLKGVSLEEMKEGYKETEYLENKLTLEDDRGAAEFENVKLEGRGNTTWMMRKKPWQIKLSQKEELLEGQEAKKWVMLANFADTSFMRNDVALKMAEMTGAKFSQRGDFVEVYFDDAKEGLYYLVPKIEIEKGGVELKDRLGVLVELDDLHKGVEGGDEECYYSYHGGCFSVEDAVSKKDKETKTEAMESFLKSFNQLEIAIEQKNLEKVKELIDIESLAKYFLVNEFTVNPDAYVTSFYFYKDGVEDKIHAGPVWDFDLALANRRWFWSKNPDFYSPTETMAQRVDAFSETGERIKGGTAYLMYDLMEFPEFQEEVRRVFRENLSGRKNELLAHYDLAVEKIRPAAEWDIAKWQEEEPMDRDFVAEVGRLRDWIEARYDYFERIYGVERRGGKPSPL